MPEAEAALEKAQRRALLLLEHRERSHSEMEQRLLRAGFEAEVVSRVLEWLSGLCYLDDARFARSYVASKRRTGWGPVRIRRELILKGVPGELIEAALREGGEQGEGVEGPSEAEAALVSTLTWRFAGKSGEDQRAARRRAAAYLARRGHEWPDIQRILAQVFVDVDDADE